MWWVLGPVGGLVAYLLKRGGGGTAKAAPLSPLEQNLIALREDLRARLGRQVVIVGQPGAGKSSLLGSLTEGRCYPPPIVGAETDTTDWSVAGHRPTIHSCDGYHFVDAPGTGTTKHPLQPFLAHFPFAEFDLILFVWRGKVHSADADLYQHLKKNGLSKVLFVRTYSEDMTRSLRREIVRDFQLQFPDVPKSKLLFVSNRIGTGISGLRRRVFPLRKLRVSIHRLRKRVAKKK